MGCVRNQTIPIGAFDPYLLRVLITDDDNNFGDFDLEEISSIDFLLKKPDGSDVTFSSVIIEDQTPTYIIATYTLQAGDIDKLGGWSLVPVMSLGGPSPVYGTRRTFTVQPI